MTDKTDGSAKLREGARRTAEACRDFFAGLRGLRGTVGLRLCNWLLWETWIEVQAVDAVDTDSFLEFGRVEVAAGGQRVSGVETDADTRFFLDQVDDVGSVKVGCKMSFRR